jgi:acyl-CoA thioester hydrolase
MSEKNARNYLWSRDQWEALHSSRRTTAVSPGELTVNADTSLDSDASLKYGFLVPVSVYFNDLDSFGLLYNGHYGVLAERAWMVYWQQREIAYSRDWELLDDGFNVVKELRISYEFPIDRPGEYGVHLWVESIGHTSLTYGFRVCSADGTRTYAHGHRTIVSLDRKTLRPCTWSRQALFLSQKLLRPDDGAGDVSLGARVQDERRR